MRSSKRYTSNLLGKIIIQCANEKEASRQLQIFIDALKYRYGQIKELDLMEPFWLEEDADNPSSEQ